MTYEELWTIYEENCAFGGVPLQDFLAALRAGEHGEIETSLVVELLQQLLEAVLTNIEVMAETNPALQDVVEEKKAEQNESYRLMIEDVKSWP